MMKSAGDQIDIIFSSVSLFLQIFRIENNVRLISIVKMSDEQSIRSSSPTVFDESFSPTRSSFFSCCQSSRRSRPSGFFHRIQIFKGKKTKSKEKKVNVEVLFS